MNDPLGSRQSRFSVRRIATAVLAICVIVAVLALVFRRRDYRPRPRIERSPAAVQERVIEKSTADSSGDTGRAPVEATPGPIPGLRMLVTSEESRPLGGADVWILAADGSIASQGKTDESGLLALKHADRGLWYVCRAPGFVPVSGQVLMAPDETAVLVALSKATTLRGRVLLPDGAAPTTPVIVTTWAVDSGRPSDSDMIRAGTSDPRRLSTRVQGDGWFAFDEVRHGVYYALTAGGPGFVTPTMPSPILAGTSEAVITVRPLYVLLIRAVDEHGDALQCPQGVDIVPSQSVDRFSTTLQPADPLGACLSLAMAGCPDELLPTRPQVGCLGFAFTSDAVEDKLGPVKFFGSIPGYFPITAPVWAYRAVPPFRVNEVRMRPTGDSRRGSVRVSLLTDLPASSFAETPAARGTRSDPFAIVSLLPDPPGADGIVSLQSLFWQPSAQPLLVENLLPGRYRVALRAALPMGSRRPAPEWIEVRPDGTTDVALSLDGCGGLEVQAVDGAGNLLSSEARIEVGWDAQRTRESHTVHFRGPPYRILGLRAGAYSVVVKASPLVGRVPDTVVERGTIQLVRVDMTAEGR